MSRAAGLALAVAAAAAALPASEKEPFRHGPHVAGQWLSLPEVGRDCRGCHDYERGRDPQAVCLDCHYRESLRWAGSTPAFETGLDPLRDPTAPFRHKDHLRYDCKRCHAPPTGGPAVVPDDMPVPKGSGVCQECHDPKDSKAPPEAKEPEVYEKLLKGLNSSRWMGPEGFRGFDHLDHLSREAVQKQDSSSCSNCHESVAQAGSLDLGEKEFALKSCASCHLQEHRGPVAFLTKEAAWESRSAATFPHDKHLGAQARERDAAIREKGCFACHLYEEKKATFDLKAKFGDYGACVACHAHESWKVADHGEVDNCSGCHTVGTGEMKTNRPRTEVSRPRPASFRIETQAHPFITGASATQTEDCARCHLAPLREAPSRIQEKEFSHATHLPAEPRAEDCLACHASKIGATNTSAEIKQTYGAETCSRCHRGGEIEAAMREASPRRVPEFSHASHLQKVGCLDCHKPDQSLPALDVGTLPKALDCSQCHSHSVRPEITGGKDQNYVAACARCHASGVPRKGTSVSVLRLALAGSQGSQFHPKDSDCKTCHAVPHRGLLLKSEPNVFGISRDSKVHDRAGTPESCLCCHWDRQQTPKYHPRGFQAKAGQGVVQAIRESFGNSMEGFPGEKCQR